MSNRPLTTGQVAKICRVSMSAVIRWCDEGKLAHYRIPNISESSRHRRILTETLRRFMVENHLPTTWLDEYKPIEAKNG